MSIIYIKWQVVAYDWGEVICEFEDHAHASAFAENMDGLALRCFVRPVRDRRRELKEELKSHGG